jgi:hypothetical protein
LLIFGLEEKAALVRPAIFGTTEFDQMSPSGDSLDADTSGEDIIQGNDKKIPRSEDSIVFSEFCSRAARTSAAARSPEPMAPSMYPVQIGDVSVPAQ